MAKEEKRILIDVINPGINCVYRLDNDPKGQSLCKHNGNMEPVTAKECRHCDEGMSRQETIDLMAKALVEYEKTNNPNACEWADLKERTKDVYRSRAEYALNAILED